MGRHSLQCMSTIRLENIDVDTAEMKVSVRIGMALLRTIPASVGRMFPG